MPHQLGVTIRATVAPGRAADLREWLVQTGRRGMAEIPFDFAHLRGVHFARLFLFEDAVDLDGQPIPASLVYMSEVDAPLRRHLAELVDVAGEGIDLAFGHCEGYPRPGARRRIRIRWLRRHLVSASAVYVNTVGRGLEQIRQEAKLRGELQDYLDRTGHEWSADTPERVRTDIQTYVAGRPDLAWAIKPPARPSLVWRAREAVHLVGVPLVVLLLLPLLLVALPAWAGLLRLSERRDVPDAERPTPEHVRALASCEDFVTQNPFAAIGLFKSGLLRRTTARGVLFAIDYAVRHVYNHNDLAGVKTIHFARWVPLDGWRRMVFASNYDGSLESYMDDFIDRLGWGLNAVFSNGQGYPRTRWLLFGGAQYEQDFKYYLRRHQVPVVAWYSAYPTLTAHNIENNARIRAGLCGDLMPAETEQWLSLL
ncbi:MAG TPA: hypothetical protein VLJ59_07425 [Mycobacteriales bacterium]|nr:hypothetical protein [Mycobacteriales bacterium]